MKQVLALVFLGILAAFLVLTGCDRTSVPSNTVIKTPDGGLDKGL